MTLRLTALAAIALGLAACTTETATPETPAPDPAPAPQQCIADQFQSFVGQKSPEITVPPGTLMRHYRSGDPITMDLNPSRVNFEYNRSGVLVKVSCG